MLIRHNIYVLKGSVEVMMPGSHLLHFSELKWVPSSVGSMQRGQWHVKNLPLRKWFCRAIVPLSVYVYVA